MKNKDSSTSLSQVYRLQNKIEEIKRMESDEFYKVKRDEIRIRKDLEEMKLKYRRSNDELTKLKQKEEELNELTAYFQNKREQEEQELVKKQLLIENQKFSLLGLLRHKDKRPILWLTSFLELPELNAVSMLNKEYRNVLCNENTFVWRSKYRSINIIHRESREELTRQIEVKAQELKNIVPMKQIDVTKLTNSEGDSNLKDLILTYVVDETVVGDCIRNTMHNTKIFLHDQYEYMQKLFYEEQERIRKEKEIAQQKQASGGGLANRFFSVFKTKTTTAKPEIIPEEVKSYPKKNIITEDDEDIDNKNSIKSEEQDYLMSTNNQNKEPENANLIDFGDDTPNQPSMGSQNEIQNNEPEVPIKFEERGTNEENEWAKTETDTVNQNYDIVEDSQDFNIDRQRERSDSLSSTSTNKLFTRANINEFMNIDELHKFLYKYGALLVTQNNSKMMEWIEWMQRTLAEYYVYWQVLYKQAKDVETLKDFFSDKVQKLQFKLEQVTNEKEDLEEQQNAEAGIKEYLAKQMQELNIK